MTDLRATERLLEHITEQADLIAAQSPGVAEPATAIHDAIDELRRRGDTLVRREDLRFVLGALTEGSAGDPHDFAPMHDVITRLDAALGGAS
ncbi:MAG: hypothetical protein ABI927_05125 [Gaiellaceae bacterium]